MSDAELLQRYVQTDSADAFRAIVDRYVNLVYSVARRHVSSPALAEEVAQSVFIELSRQAARIKPGTPLIAWLHLVSRRRAINVVRDAARRRTHEQLAAELTPSAMTPTEPPWTAVAPLLDEAVESLNVADRTAILLRFFDNKSLREVGAALGTSEDTAQKRVSRALDRLRELLLRRGIAASAAGLAADLSAHAIESAPASLRTSIGATRAMSLAGKATGTIAMTTLQKAILGSAVALTLGTGVFEAMAAVRQRAELRDVQQQTADVLTAARIARLAAERSTRELTSLRAERAAVSAPTADPATAAAIQAWNARVDALKQMLAQHPEWSAPEVALADSSMWFQIARNVQLDNPDSVRHAFEQIRHGVENDLANRLAQAVRAYLAAQGGQPPTSAAELAPLCDPPLDAVLLQRFRVIPPEERMTNRGYVLIEDSPVDPDCDMVWMISRGGGFSNESAASYAVRLAQRAFGAANGGAKATTPLELAPYLKFPVSTAKVQEILQSAAQASSR
jgi:RNA polymerase sigma factor (sigma-70 family)